MFESPKEDSVSTTRVHVAMGRSVHAEMQTLQHHNTAQSVMVAGVNQNELIRSAVASTTRWRICIWTRNWREAFASR
jgi:hypothetical protein